MNFQIITNENFNTVNNFVKYIPFYSDNELKFYRNENFIIFETNFICCPCIYWIKKGDLWAFSFAVEDIENWCVEHNIELEERTSFDEFGELANYFSNNVKRNYKYKGINYIEGWKKVLLRSDGTFEKENYILPLFSLELKDNYDLYKKWILKYKRMVKKDNDEELFIPCIGPKLDERIFTCLYRNLNLKLSKWYLNDKNDSPEVQKNRTAISQEIIERLKFNNFSHVRSIKNHSSFCSSLVGEFSSNIRSMTNPNDINYIYQYIQHAFSNDIEKDKYYTPYTDDIWVCFKQEYHVADSLNALMFCEDLLDIDLYSIQEERYNFYDKYKDTIPKAKEIMDYWGEEKCKTILIDEE